MKFSHLYHYDFVSFNGHNEYENLKFHYILYIYANKYISED